MLCPFNLWPFFDLFHPSVIFVCSFNFILSYGGSDPCTKSLPLLQSSRIFLQAKKEERRRRAQDLLKQANISKNMPAIFDTPSRPARVSSVSAPRLQEVLL